MSDVYHSCPDSGFRNARFFLFRFRIPHSGFGKFAFRFRIPDSGFFGFSFSGTHNTEQKVISFFIATKDKNDKFYSVLIHKNSLKPNLGKIILVYDFEKKIPNSGIPDSETPSFFLIPVPGSEKFKIHSVFRKSKDVIPYNYDDVYETKLDND